MTVLRPPYRRTRPLATRRALALSLGLGLVVAQLGLPSLDSTHWAGLWPLLTLPVIGYSLHGLTSDTWTWNRLFRTGPALDEYEVHARNSFIARAYTLAGPLMWIGFAALLLGGGLIRAYPALNPFAGANETVAVALYISVIVSLFGTLPRVVAALSEPDPDQ